MLVSIGKLFQISHWCSGFFEQLGFGFELLQASEALSTKKGQHNAGVLRQRFPGVRVLSEEERTHVPFPEEARLAAVAAAEEAARPLHEANEWDISVSGGDEGEAEATSGKSPCPGGADETGVSGVSFAMPRSEKLDQETLDAFKVRDTGAGLDDLMSQLQGLNAGKQ